MYSRLYLLTGLIYCVICALCMLTEILLLHNNLLSNYLGLPEPKFRTFSIMSATQTFKRTYSLSKSLAFHMNELVEECEISKTMHKCIMWRFNIHCIHK